MSDLALFELSIDAPDSEEHTSLHLAVMYNEPAVVEVLLRFGADVSAVDRVCILCVFRSNICNDVISLNRVRLVGRPCILLP